MAEIDRVVTVWDARFDRLEEKLNKAVRATYGAAGKVEKRLDATNNRINTVFGKPIPAGATRGLTEFGRAISNVKTATLQQLAPGADRYATALGHLGVAGVAAGVGIAGVAAAFSGAREATRFADDIADTANRLHVTTDALQEYRFAIRAAGGEEKGADEALEAFNVTLGGAHQGAKKALKGFQALFGQGFTAKDVENLGDADAALKAVTERLQGLGDADRDKVIAQLGLTGLKPALQDGVQRLQDLRDEAHKLGLVMDADLVKRGGELNDQFETASKVIDVQLKSALIDAAPFLLDLLKFAGELAKEAATIADTFRSIQNKRTEHLKDLRGQFAERAASPVGLVTGAHDRQRIAEIDAELDKRAAADKADAAKRAAAAKGTSRVPDLSKAGGRSGSGPRDDSAQRAEQVNSAIAGAERELLQALLGITEDVRTRAALQKQILAAEAAQDAAQLARQKADIEADKGLSSATKQQLIAKLQAVADDQLAARLAREIAIDRQAEAELARQALELKETTLDGEEQQLRQAQDLTRSSSQQQAIALRLVEIAYEREKAELEAVIASKSVSEADRQIARLKLQQLEQQQPGRVEDARRNGSDPAREANSIIGGVVEKSNLAEDTAAMYAEIERQRQANLISEEQAAQAAAEVHARYLEKRLSNAQSFFGDLATLSQSSNKTLAAIGKAAAIAQATIDGILAVQKALASAPPPFNFALAAAAGAAAAVNVAKIAGLADGGPVRGPGGPRSDSVPIMASNGEFMVNASAAARWRPQLEAINNGGVPRFAAGGPIGSLSAARISGLRHAPPPAAPLHFHLEGAVVTQELLDQMNEISRTHSGRAYVGARRDAAADAARAQYHRDLNA